MPKLYWTGGERPTGNPVLLSINGTDYFWPNSSWVSATTVQYTGGWAIKPGFGQPGKGHGLEPSRIGDLAVFQSIVVGGGLVVYFDAPPISGVQTENGVTVYTQALELIGNTSLNLGKIEVLSGGSLLLSTGFKNPGALILDSVFTAPTLLKVDGDTTLTGHGHITLSGRTNNYIFNSGSYFYNTKDLANPFVLVVTPTTLLENVDNHIDGSGFIGNGHLPGPVNPNANHEAMTLKNDAKGIIEAAYGDQLFLNTGHNKIQNKGILEATANNSPERGPGGTLTIESDVTNSGTILATGGGTVSIQSSVIDNTGGHVTADQNSEIDLFQSTINNGLVKIGIGGKMDASGNADTIDHTKLSIDASGVLIIQGGTVVTLGGSADINASGRISIQNGGALLVATDNLQITGAGRVDMAGVNSVITSAGSAKLTNVDNLIVGSGLISNVTLVNQHDGVVKAGAGDVLQIIALNLVADTNVGSLEAAAGGTLILSHNFNNRHGTIDATETGSKLVVDGIITGGSLIVDVGAFLFARPTVGTVDVFIGVDITNSGQIIVEGPTEFSRSTITNTGGDSISYGAGSSRIDFENSTMHGGTITIAAGKDFNVSGHAAIDQAATFDNTGNFHVTGGLLNLGEDITVTGGDVHIDADAQINANGATDTIKNATITNAGRLLEPGIGTLKLDHDTITNTGTFWVEDQGAGSMIDIIGGTIANTGGTIKATGEASVAEMGVIRLTGVIITGGTVSTTAGGKIDAIDLSSSTMNVDTIKNGGAIFADDGAILNITSAKLSSTGTIEANGPASEVIVHATVQQSAAGIIKADNGGYVDVDQGVNSGHLVISGDHSTIEINARSTAEIDFTGGPVGGQVILHAAHAASNNIYGFDALNTIDLRDFVFDNTTMTAKALVNVGVQLVIKDGTGGKFFTFHGSYLPDNFAIHDDGHGGTLITDPPVGPAVLDGSVGGMTLAAGASPAALIGGPNDVLYGGAGADTFIFGPEFGPNTVNEFQPGKDTLQFDHNIFTDSSAVQGHMQQVGTDVVIAADAANTVTLHNTAITNLLPSDFHIV